MLGLGEVDEDALYTALDWLLERQSAIETILAKRHLTTSQVAAARSPSVATAATAGRAHRRSPAACSALPAVRSPSRCSTALTQVTKLKQRFHRDHIVLVGDRGMITQARTTEDIKSAGLDWITALRAPAIKTLLQSGTLQLSPFDQRDMASITAPNFLGERLVVCRNPLRCAHRPACGRSARGRPRLNRRDVATTRHAYGTTFSAPAGAAWRRGGPDRSSL